MDRSWMYKKRNTLEYVHGVQEFVKIAEEYASKIGENYIVCPCYDCRNLKKFRSSEQIKEHLIRRGFKIGYDRWIWHGETVLTSNSTNEREGRKNVEKDQSNEDNVGNDGDNDRIDELMRDMQGDLNEMPQEFESFFESSGKPLFSGCSKFTKLSAVLKLYTVKAKHRWSDKSFTELLELLKGMLPNENELPCSTYEAKKMLCPLSMEIERIHACPNDCILYWNQNKDLHVCPKCGASRYKRKGLDDACEQKKGPPAKLLWYLPVIPRFKRLFANAKDAKNLQWHASGRKEDGKLRDESKRMVRLIKNLPFDLDYINVDLDEAIFHHQDVDFIHVLFQDIKDLLTMRWLDVTILQIFIICLSRMCSKIGLHTIGFLCPRTICATSVLADIDKVTKYLVNALVEQTHRHFILAPYHEKNHWMLLVISVRLRKVYVLDSIALSDRELAIKATLNVAFRSVETLGGRRPKNNVDWVHIECPQQPGGVECGYYVMRFMYEICTQCWDSDDLDMELFFNRKPYSEAQIDEIWQQLKRNSGSKSQAGMSQKHHHYCMH